MSSADQFVAKVKAYIDARLPKSSDTNSGCGCDCKTELVTDFVSKAIEFNGEDQELCIMIPEDAPAGVVLNLNMIKSLPPETSAYFAAVARITNNEDPEYLFEVEVSDGADTLFTVQNPGDLVCYRFRTDDLEGKSGPNLTAQLHYSYPKTTCTNKGE